MSEDNGASNETARIEVFSDGVFAVAITLLIFQIRIPPHKPPGGLRSSLSGRITWHYAIGPILYTVLV